MKKFVVIVLALGLASLAGTLVYRQVGTYLAPVFVSSTSASAEPMQTAWSSSEESSSSNDVLMPFGEDVSATVQAHKIEYRDYRTGVIGGQKLLLFFSSSDEGSKTSDLQLASLYFSGRASLATYRIDFDTATALGEKYGVTAPNTFVVIDESGSILRSAVNPSAEVLEGLLK